MTTCPCAQDIMKERAISVLQGLGVPDEKIDLFLQEVPMATHNQRGRGFLCIEIDDDQHVELEKIIAILKESMSAPIFELLKRSDESYVVLNAHKNPRFVEDCVREVAKRVLHEFHDLPGDSARHHQARRTRRASTSMTRTPSARRRSRNSSTN